MKRLLLASALGSLALQGCATPMSDTAAAAAPASAAAVPAERSGPALWKVADEDTTVYLFGTVHALPQETDWYRGPIAEALQNSEELVTEIPSAASRDPASQQTIMAKAMLPADASLRTMLNDADRTSYETALTTLGMPPGAFDRFEPWFAGMTLAILPLLKSGYSAESGVELTIEELAPASATRGALETLDWQIDLFDSLPEASQVAFLMASADNIDEVAPLMDRMVAEWLEGDADGLAELMNMGLTDATLAEALLYSRNARWAGWIDERMDTPGAVFLAVGAGHLAGERSVQDYLAERGFAVERIQ